MAFGSDMTMSNSIKNGSARKASHVTEGREEVSLLISNKKSNYISSSNESFDDKEKEYSSTERIMDFHCHKISKSLDKGRGDATRTAKRKLFIACFLVLAFVILEVIGGIASQSLAIMADAAHMLSDFASFAISLLAIYLAERSINKTYNFGYYRAEVIGALLIVVIIWIVAGILVYLAVHRLRAGDYEVESDVMMIVAGCAVLFNIILGFVLHGVCKLPHSHGHSHNHAHNSRGSHESSTEHTQLSLRNDDLQSDSENDDNDEFEDCRNEKKLEDNQQHINIRAAIIHVLGDLIQSVGVLTSSIIIKFEPKYKWADPLCTILFSIIVFCTTIPIVRDTIHILIEGFPKDITSYDKVYKSLSKIPHVAHVHDLKVWSLTIKKVELICHLGVLSSEENRMQIYDEVVESATNMLRKKYGIEATTIQVEKVKKEIIQDCQRCSPLKY